MNSQEWWAAVKSDPEKLAAWLRKQYHGEVTAAYRIADMAMQSTPEQRVILMEISDQEMTHASMVLTLLSARGLDVGAHDAEGRYWSQVKSAAIGFEDKAAIATLAEGMRLERIRVIAGDADAPEDIRQVFATILVDEEWHETAFKAMTDEATVEKLRPYHNLGREVLGLEV